MLMNGSSAPIGGDSALPTLEERLESLCRLADDRAGNYLGMGRYEALAAIGAQSGAEDLRGQYRLGALDKELVARLDGMSVAELYRHVESGVDYHDVQPIG